MKNSVDIHLEPNDDESSVEDIRDFFAGFATVHINKAEPRAVKSWDKAIEIVLTIIGTWASEKYVLDPLANRASEWIKSVRAFWGKSGLQSRVNVIVKFEQGENNLEIQFIGNHEPDVLEQVWHVSKAVIELLEMHSFQVEKFRILTNTNKSLLILGYSGSQPKYTINLDKKEILPIKTTSNADESEYNPEAELWVISVLERRLEYLKFVKQVGNNISETEIANLELEIQNKKNRLSLTG